MINIRTEPRWKMIKQFENPGHGRGNEKWVNYWNSIRHKVIQPGVIVKTVEGRIYVIGDTNLNGGTCDCCRAWHEEDLVAYSLALVGVVARTKGALEVIEI